MAQKREAPGDVGRGRVPKAAPAGTLTAGNPFGVTSVTPGGRVCGSETLADAHSPVEAAEMTETRVTGCRKPRDTLSTGDPRGRPWP